MNQFMWGALTVAGTLAGLFFLRFWRSSRDRLFVFFACAFWALAANWAALGVMNPSIEHRHLVYLLRLAAFGLIIIGIVDKNRRHPGG